MNNRPDSFAIRIDTTVNGYMVQPAKSLHSDCYIGLDSTHVYESFDALVEHLRRVLPIFPAFDPPAPNPKRAR